MRRVVGPGPGQPGHACHETPSVASSRRRPETDAPRPARTTHPLGQDQCSGTLLRHDDGHEPLRVGKIQYVRLMGMTRLRSVGATTVGLCLLALVTGCSNRLESAELAAAKCTRAVSLELGLPEGDTTLNLTGVLVEGTDAERTVEGRWVHPNEGEGPFTCVVVPDAADKLRGLRVTSVDVQAAPPR